MTVTDENQKAIKSHCQAIVDIIKEMQKEGEPLGWEIQDVRALLLHLYDPSLCREKPQWNG